MKINFLNDSARERERLGRGRQTPLGTLPLAGRINITLPGHTWSAQWSGHINPHIGLGANVETDDAAVTAVIHNPLGIAYLTRSLTLDEAERARQWLMLQPYEGRGFFLGAGIDTDPIRHSRPSEPYLSWELGTRRSNEDTPPSWRKRRVEPIKTLLGYITGHHTEIREEDVLIPLLGVLDEYVLQADEPTATLTITRDTYWRKRFPNQTRRITYVAHLCVHSGVNPGNPVLDELVELLAELDSRHFRSNEGLGLPEWSFSAPVADPNRVHEFIIRAADAFATFIEQKRLELRAHRWRKAKKAEMRRQRDQDSLFNEAYLPEE